MRRFLAIALIAVIGCSGQGSILEAGARVPDEEGVVTDVSFERIMLDGDRAFRISTDVESFTTRSHEPTSLLFWKDKYVHLGLKGDEVVWVGGIGVVRKSEPRTALYTGIFDRTDRDGRAFFEDGTVLRLADGVEVPERGSEVLVTIDPQRKLITAMSTQ